MKDFKRSVFLIFSFLMLLACLIGIGSTIIVPYQLREENRKIEEMIRLNQEKAQKEIEEAKKEKEEALQKAKEEKEEALQKVTENKPLTIKELKNLYEDASEMNLTFIGDSVTLAAYDALAQQFPNAYIDAEFGRVLNGSLEVLKQLEENNQLGSVVIFSVGTNSWITEENVEELIAHCDSRPVFFMTTYGVSNDSNEKTSAVCDRHENAWMIDWETLATKHANEYILADHLHPNEEGSKAYATLINEEVTTKLQLKGTSQDEEEKAE